MYSANGGAWLASSAWAHRWWLPAIEPSTRCCSPASWPSRWGWPARRSRGVASRPARDAAAGGCRAKPPASTCWSRSRLLGLVRTRCRPLHGALRTIPIFSFLRAPARLGLLVALSLCLLAAVAVAALLARPRRPRAGRPRWLVLAAAAELNAAPLRALREAEPVARAYRTLARCRAARWPSFPTSTGAPTSRDTPTTCSTRRPTGSRSSTATATTSRRVAPRRGLPSVRSRPASRSTSSAGSARAT